MNRKKCIAVLAGDGIGPEVMPEALKVLAAVAPQFGFEYATAAGLIGGAAIDSCGEALPSQTIELCRRADAILLGSIGGPRWDNLPADKRPELAGLLALRKELQLFANIRPVTLFTELRHFSPLAYSRTQQPIDLVTVRELSSGIYYGQPKSLTADLALDSMVYRRPEIERIARTAFDIARGRRKLVTSVDKANVLNTSMLWRSVVKAVAADFPDVELRHMYVDNAAMQMVLNPSQFDVIVTENLFGDILSDESAALAGSLGMLPSASIGGRVHLYEPAGGSAPDIAGHGVANPIAQILSLALMLEYSFGLADAARAIYQAVRLALRRGFRTRDIALESKKAVSTAAMGDAVCACLQSDVSESRPSDSDQQWFNSLAGFVDAL